MKMTEAAVKIVESFNKNGPSWLAILALTIMAITLLVTVISIVWFGPSRLLEGGDAVLNWIGSF